MAQGAKSLRRLKPTAVKRTETLLKTAAETSRQRIPQKEPQTEFQHRNRVQPTSKSPLQISSSGGTTRFSKRGDSNQTQQSD